MYIQRPSGKVPIVPPDNYSGNAFRLKNEPDETVAPSAPNDDATERARSVPDRAEKAKERAEMGKSEPYPADPLPHASFLPPKTDTPEPEEARKAQATRENGEAREAEKPRENEAAPDAEKPRETVPQKEGSPLFSLSALFGGEDRRETLLIGLLLLLTRDSGDALLTALLALLLIR